MSIKIMSAIWEGTTCEGATLLVLLALADYANDKGVCWPSVASLAAKARVTERHTQRLLKRLERRELIAVDVNGGPKGVNVYTVKQRGDILSPDIAAHREPACQGDNRYPGGVSQMSPKPSLEPSLGRGIV